MNVTEFSNNIAKKNNLHLKLTKHFEFKNAGKIMSHLESKMQYFENVFLKNSGDTKKYWDGIKTIVTLKAKAKFFRTHSRFITDISLLIKLQLLKHSIMFLSVSALILRLRLLNQKKSFNSYLKNR